MGIKLHGLVGSTATFRVLAALAEKDLDFEFVSVDLVSKEQKTPQFLARNPFGQVPVYEDGDLNLFESRAITKYIAEAYADKGTPLISKDPKKSAIQTVWSEVEGQKYDPVSSKLVYQLIIFPMRGATTDEAIVAESEKKLADILDVYELRLTK
ncbi:glutathione S-transferase-like protein, partial [Tanacetum coccineum]